MTDTPLLQRHRARDEVRELIQQMIQSGELAGGVKLDEVKLSARIGVSRTPLREALIALESEGLVRSAPNKGYTVVRADADLVREIYPILAALESEALRLGAAEARARAAELRALNDRLNVETAKAKQYRLDEQFHTLLVAGCANQRLMAMLATFRAEAVRADGAHKRGMADREGSCREYVAVIKALEAGDVDEAERRLRLHYRRGAEVVIKWLEQTK